MDETLLSTQRGLRALVPLGTAVGQTSARGRGGGGRLVCPTHNPLNTSINVHSTVNDPLDSQRSARQEQQFRRNALRSVFGRNDYAAFEVENTVSSWLDEVLLGS